MPIQISQQPAILDWNTKSASLEQSGNAALALDIQTQKPQLDMQTQQAKISIDQSQSFEEAGLKNIRAFMDDAVSYSSQILSAGIERIISDGNTWIEIQNGSDPIPDQANYNAYGMFEKEFNYAAIPTSRPQISVQPGTVNYQFNPGKVNNNSQVRKVQMNYNPYQINYYMKQYASVSISYEDPKYKFMV